MIDDVVKEVSVPKFLHMTNSVAEMPPEISQNIENIKNTNKDWEVVFYDDERVFEFIKTNFDPAILKAYNKINKKYGAAKADFFRYLVIYKCGGVYLDIKSSVSVLLDDLVSDSGNLIISQWDNCPEDRHADWGVQPELQHVQGGAFIQWFIAAPKESPLILSVIERVMKNISNYNPFVDGVGQMGVLRTTGPIPYTLAIYPMLNQCAHKNLGRYNLAGLIYSIYESEKGGGVGEHKKLFTRHYSKLDEPVIKGFSMYNLLWVIKLLYNKCVRL